MTFRAELIVRPRPGVRDPQAAAVEEALRGLDAGDTRVRCVGRYLELRVEAATEAQARQTVEDMCRRLLVNPNLETYELDLRET